MDPSVPGTVWPTDITFYVLNGFQTQIIASLKEDKKIHECQSSSGDLCDLCKLGECIWTEMWPGFAFFLELRHRS